MESSFLLGTFCDGGEGMIVAKAKEEWEEFKNDEYLEDDNLF